MPALNSPVATLLFRALERLQELRKTSVVRFLFQIYRSLGLQRLTTIVCRLKSKDKRCPTYSAAPLSKGDDQQSVTSAPLCLPPSKWFRRSPSKAVVPVELQVVIVSPSSSLHLSADEETLSPSSIDLTDPSVTIGGTQAVPSPHVAEQSQAEVALLRDESQINLDWMTYTIMPSQLSRYERTVRIDPVEPRYVIKPGQTEFKIAKTLPKGWTRHTNSEGQSFFHHEEKNMLTEAWLYDLSVQAIIIQVGDYLHSRAQELFPPDVAQTSQLVLSLKFCPEYEDKPDDDGWRCGYYFAHHPTRNLHWVEDFVIDNSRVDIRGELAPEHVKIYIAHQYWIHFECFDDVQQSSPADWGDLFDMMAVAAADLLTSTSSTSNESKETLDSMQRISSEARKNLNFNPCASSWILGRFMSRLTKDRFQNFYGQYGARLNSFESIHGQTINHTLLFEIFSPVLFSAPNVHLKTLEEMWVDGLTRQEPWKALVAKLTAEWETHKFFGTILLTTNAAFLAIPSVDLTDPIHQLVKLLSYLSMIGGLGCMILASLLHRQHKTREFSVTEAAEFLWKQNHREHGLETLAVMYSLPYALSMWGTVFFLAAFLVMCYASENRTTIGVIFASWSIVTILIIWCVKMAWQPGKWSKLAIKGYSEGMRKKNSFMETFRAARPRLSFNLLWTPATKAHCAV